MRKEEIAANNPQLSGVEQIISSILGINGQEGSSSELTKMIDKLVDTRKTAIEQEKNQLCLEKEKRKSESSAKLSNVCNFEAMELPLDWENAFWGDERVADIHTDSIPDALVLSLSNLGRVDIEYISSITGRDLKSVITTLSGSIYQNPETWDECFYKGWETAEEYLSGNLVRKLKTASEANKTYRGYFKNNIEAIKSVLPETVACEDIYVTLGSPWVPVDIIDSFIVHILNLKGRVYATTKHDEYTGTWEISNKNFYWNNVGSHHTYGTPRLEALYILEKTLNMQTVAVTDEIRCTTTKSGKKRVLNQTETVLALEKQQKMIAEFQRWVWQDKLRKRRLEEIFENKFSCVRRRIFDGSFLTFPSMSKDITLFPYQKNAVARILFSPNTLLAHDVGSGKTYVMIAAGMELKRMGLSKKNLYVVPNSIIGQWRSIFASLYPNANVMCVEPKDFVPERRARTLRAIRDNEYDAIIMAYSCFDRIPLSRDFYANKLKEKMERLQAIAQNKSKATSGVNRKKEALSKALGELTQTVDDMYGDVYFDELGITRLFVDEAHNYKNVPLDTKTDRVLGISSAGSKKCREMMDKVRFIQKQNGGGGVVLATGTPITNSITDAFIMQKYLQSGELGLLDLQSFDSWIGMFAERVTEFEIDVDTSGYRLATRFSKFHNLPELTALLSSIADFHQTDDTAGIPAFDGYTDSLIGRTPEFCDYLKSISERAEMVRHGGVSRRDDNMLKITTDGRKAALDLRLVDDSAGFTFQSKIARCAERVFDLYVKGGRDKTAQLVFCDSSTPKAGFNVYDDLKRLLIDMGIPSNEIAFVHDASTDAQRTRLFSKVQKGELRVLIGSTFKLGIGVNVQDRLVAIHHLDVPWRPADMTQREGRILRQGNECDKVYIHRYITEGSFDAYSWQLLETKQRFISGLLSGALCERSGSDIEGTVLDYAEVKALAVGNPRIKQRVETANELSRTLSLQRKAIENHVRLQKELSDLPAKIKNQRDAVAKCAADLEVYNENKRKLDKEERKRLREELFEAVKGNALMESERKAATYQGFDVILPCNMYEQMPYVWLEANGRYYVELGDTELGVLVRIDNFLNSLEAHREKLEGILTEMYAKRSALKTELAKKDDYADKIEELKTALENLDKELGVTKK